MIDLTLEKTLTKLLKMLDRVEKYIISIPEPFSIDIIKYKHAMIIMNDIIAKIIHHINTITNENTSNDKYLQEICDDLKNI